MLCEGIKAPWMKNVRIDQAMRKAHKKALSQSRRCLPAFFMLYEDTVLMSLAFQVRSTGCQQIDVQYLIDNSQKARNQ